jgi:hypothetical protein
VIARTLQYDREKGVADEGVVALWTLEAPKLVGNDKMVDYKKQHRCRESQQ